MKNIIITILSSLLSLILGALVGLFCAVGSLAVMGKDVRESYFCWIDDTLNGRGLEKFDDSDEDILI